MTDRQFLIHEALFRKKHAEIQVPEVFRVLYGTTIKAIGTLVLHPLDMIKIRIQLCLISGQKWYPRSLRRLMAKEGVSVLYHGISAGMLRQVMFALPRMTIFARLNNYMKDEDGNDPNFKTELLIDTASLASAAFISAPADLALIRMTVDTCIVKSNRKRYRHVFEALYRIQKKEGLFALWTGATPSVMHALVGTMTGILSYPYVERYLSENYQFRDVLYLHVTGAMLTEVLCTLTALPHDIVKTKLQSMRVRKKMRAYRGPFDVLKDTLQKEGILGLWAGFLPYYLRRGPHTVFTIIMLDYMADCYSILHPKK